MSWGPHWDSEEIPIIGTLLNKQDGYVGNFPKVGKDKPVEDSDNVKEIGKK